MFPFAYFLLTKNPQKQSQEHSYTLSFFAFLIDAKALDLRRAVS